jgi:hypothetical protein
VRLLLYVGTRILLYYNTFTTAIDLEAYSFYYAAFQLIKYLLGYFTYSKEANFI